jgi:hypothetical protein
VQDLLKKLTGMGIRKNLPGQGSPIQRTIRLEHFPAESLHDPAERWLTGLHEVTRETVGIDHRNSTLQEKLFRGGFTHPKSAGDAYGGHVREKKPARILKMRAGGGDLG